MNVYQKHEKEDKINIISNTINPGIDAIGKCY